MIQLQPAGAQMPLDFWDRVARECARLLIDKNAPPPSPQPYQYGAAHAG